MSSARLTFGLLWQNYGPYHVARYESFRAAATDADVIPIQLGDSTSTYAWQRDQRLAGRLVTLFPGKVSEKVSAVQVYRRLCRLITERRIDVLFIPSYWPTSSMAALVAARRMGIRLVMMNDSHFQSGRNTGLAFLFKQFLLGYYDAGLVGGSIHRAFFRQLGMPDDRIFEGYDVVDNDYFAAQAAEVRANAAHWRADLHLPERYILSLGRFVKKKNLPVLVEAYARLAADGQLNGHELVFVGSGPERATLLQTCQVHQLPVWEADAGVPAGPLTPRGRVRFHPFAQIDKVPAFYALATCFVLPSKVEEWGLVVNEAMACSCPVIVSSVAGCTPDLVVPKVTGFRFDPGDPRELARRLDQVCGDLRQAQAVGEAARNHISQWSLAGFGRNAVEAAHAALWVDRRSLLRSGRTQGGMRIRFLQTCLPDYREQVFGELHLRYGRRFELVRGESYFTPDIKVSVEFKPWQIPVENVFLFGRTLLWQRGALRRMCDADIAVLELNPRVLSTWLILISRWLAGSPTLTWGHAWSRNGRDSWTNIPRLMMMRLSKGVIPYSLSQAQELRPFLAGVVIIAAPNSLTLRGHCTFASVPLADVGDILYVGRLNLQKKPMLLVRGFIAALPRLPARVRLVLVGAGVEVESVRQLVEHHHLADRVLLRGHINDPEVLRTKYARAFCAVSPGYVGLSAIQSFAHGVPLVVADHEPHAPEIEACIEGKTARFFLSDDAGDLADKLVQMWEERADWYARRSELSDWTKANYSVESMVDGFHQAIGLVSVGMEEGAGVEKESGARRQEPGVGGFNAD